jgi:predicted nucleic acid-binding protein
VNRRARRRRAAVIRERRAAYGPVVVDASVAVQWFSNEIGSATAARLLEADQVLLAPDLMPVEAVNAWWKKVRLGNMETSDLDQALVNLLSLGIEFATSVSLLPRASRLALDGGHPVYDCLYLALALNRTAQLATDDRELRRAAARLDIPVWKP